VLHDQIITWCSSFEPHLPQAMKYANLDQLSPLWVPRFSNCQHFLSSPYHTSPFQVRVAIMLPAVCWEGWLAPPSLLVLPPTVAIAMRFRQYLQQNMTLRAGCSARAAKRAGVTIYRVYLRQEMPCMQWHKFIFENKIYRNKLYKNYNVAAYTMKLRISENIWEYSKFKDINWNTPA